MSIWKQSAGLQRADLDAGDMAELDEAMSSFLGNWSDWRWCFEAVRNGEPCGRMIFQSATSCVCIAAG